METASPDKSDRILLFTGNRDDLKFEYESVARQIPDAEITPIDNLSKYYETVGNRDFDIVVLDIDLASSNTPELIHQLKLKDREPGVLVISNSEDPILVADIYNSGCHKYIIKQGHWQDELGPSIRHLLRLRKLEEENRRLVVRLTEANMLLQEKNRRLDEFSATIAHDIRGPLGGISMKLDYLLDTYQGVFDARCKSLLGNALRSTQRLTQLVQSMYSYAKLGAKANQMEVVDLDQLVQEVITDMHFNAKLDIQIGLGDLPKVWGSVDLLRRLFINLLANAVKYCDKPKIIINISKRAIVKRNLGDFAEICVEDNGPGIPDAELKNIFSMFTRGSTAKGDQEGAGIGLAVVQRIVELHFGTVKVESTLNRGTSFIIALPLEKIDFAA